MEPTNFALEWGVPLVSLIFLVLLLAGVFRPRSSSPTTTQEE